jgi:hypothetical protein
MKTFDFDNLLRTARDEVPVPASFKQDVWDRIASSKSELSQGVIWFQAFAAGLARPWGAAVGIAATVTLGLWLGSSGISNSKNSEVAYAMSISPFSQAHRK